MLASALGDLAARASRSPLRSGIPQVGIVITAPGEGRLRFRDLKS